MKQTRKIVETVECIHKGRIKFLDTVETRDYKEVVKQQLQNELDGAALWEDDDASVDRMYQRLSGVLMSREARIHTESYNAASETAFSLIDKYRFLFFVCVCVLFGEKQNNMIDMLIWNINMPLAR